MRTVLVSSFVAILILSLLISGTSCRETVYVTITPTPTPATTRTSIPTPTAQQIVTNVVEAVGNQYLAKFDLHLESNLNAALSKQQTSVKATQDYTGSLDLASQQLQLTGNGVIEVPDKYTFELSMYAVDETVYSMIRGLGYSGEWFKMEPTQEQYSGFYYNWGMIPWQVNLLKTSDVELLGNERLAAIDCYVLNIKPDLDEIWNIVSQPGGFMAGGATSFNKPTNVSDVIKNVSIKEWVAKDTFLPVRFDVSLRLLINPKYIQYQDYAQGTIDNQLQFVYYGYGNPISISLPPEAERAQEVPWSY